MSFERTFGWAVLYVGFTPETDIQGVLKDPRQFVEAPDFVGPDRRRKKKGEFGGEDQRKTPPTFLEITAPAAMNPVSV